jgi:transposase
MKEEAGVSNLTHPSLSPDLNPMEGIWNILKQRVRRRTDWKTLPQLRKIMEEEWKKITIEEVRSRVEEMPWRCQELLRNGGQPIKTKHW